MRASFDDQLAIVEELLREVARMEDGEKRFSEGPARGGYERELRLAGLAQRVAQGYTIIEGVLAFVARRIDRAPVTGEDWHKKLISRCARPFDDAKRPAVISDSLAEDLLELCESGTWCGTSTRRVSLNRRCGRIWSGLSAQRGPSARRAAAAFAAASPPARKTRAPVTPPTTGE